MTPQQQLPQITENLEIPKQISDIVTQEFYDGVIQTKVKFFKLTKSTPQNHKSTHQLNPSQCEFLEIEDATPC